MANPGDFAYSVKEKADIVRIISDYLPLKRSGAQNYTGICPFHKEKTGSFSVHVTRQIYHCFGCKASGDVFTFVQKIENVTFPEAVRLVAQKLGIPLPKVQYATPAEAREAKMRGVLIDLQESACQFFERQLRTPEAAHAREYLASRGLTQEAIQKFRIGFAPESGFLLRDALKGAAEEDFLRESGLFSWKEKDGAKSAAAQAQGAAKAALYSKFRNRVMFPICNDQGKVIAFTGRTLAADEKAGPKYLNSPETPIYQKSRVLFNLHMAKEAIRQLDYAILVEGQMDCISVFNAGYHNVIASSGTAFTEAQAKLLARYSKKIVVNFDPDTAGAAAAERSLALLVAEDFEIRVLSLEQGFDPDLYIRKKGGPAYEAALRGSQRYFDYLIERARGMFKTNTAEAKVKAVNYLLPHIQRVPSRIVRDELASDIAQKLGIDSAVLREELRHVAGARSAAKVAAPKRSSITDAERVRIRARTSGQEYNIAYQDDNGQHQVWVPAEQAHYTLTTEHLHKGASTEALVDELLKAVDQGADPMSLPMSDADRATLTEILMEEAEAITPELLHSSIDALRRRHLESEQKELKRQILEAERRADNSALATLLQQKLEVDRKLRLAAIAQS